MITQQGLVDKHHGDGDEPIQGHHEKDFDISLGQRFLGLHGCHSGIGLVFRICQGNLFKLGFAWAHDTCRVGTFNSVVKERVEVNK